MGKSELVPSTCRPIQKLRVGSEGWSAAWGQGDISGTEQHRVVPQDSGAHVHIPEPCLGPQSRVRNHLALNPSRWAGDRRYGQAACSPCAFGPSICHPDQGNAEGPRLQVSSRESWALMDIRHDSAAVCQPGCQRLMTGCVVPGPWGACTGSRWWQRELSPASGEK